jgi:hypothetical protein
MCYDPYNRRHGDGEDEKFEEFIGFTQCEGPLIHRGSERAIRVSRNRKRIKGL